MKTLCDTTSSTKIIQTRGKYESWARREPLCKQPPENDNSSIMAMAGEVSSYLNGTPITLYADYEEFDLTDNPKTMLDLAEDILKDAIDVLNQIKGLL